MRQTPCGFEQRLLARTRAARFARGDRLIVGFSGGRDSLALAAAMRWPRKKIGIDPMLVHIDHRLRVESAGDAVRAQSLAADLGYDLDIRTLRDKPTRIHPGIGVEDAARRERYGVLFAVAAADRARAVVTAHHQGDQAETVLLHLLRGGGVNGAVAMRELSARPRHDISPKLQIWLWRPLLDETAASIAAYVDALGLEPIVDASNEDRALRRNALRHDALPLLEARFPGAQEALARYARLAAEDDALLEELAAAALAESVDPGGLLDAERLSELPVALQRRVVRRWLRMATEADSFSAERTEAILNLAGRGAGGVMIEIGDGWTVRRSRGKLRVAQLGGEAEGTGR